MWRRLIFGVTLILVAVNAGCVLDGYYADPDDLSQRLFQSDNGGQKKPRKPESTQLWMDLVEPSHLTPDRVDGRIAP
jgi:hypothetical protein